MAVNGNKEIEKEREVGIGGVMSGIKVQVGKVGKLKGNRVNVRIRRKGRLLR